MKIYATDPGFKSSVEAYVKLNEAVKLLQLGKENGRLVAILEKGEITPEEVEAPVRIKRSSRAELRGAEAPALSEISTEELFERMGTEDFPAILVDVRTPQEYHGLKGHIKGVKLMPLNELMYNIELLKDYKNKEIVMICEAGARSMMAAQLLIRAGFKDVRNLKGGMALWNRKGYPIEID